MKSFFHNVKKRELSPSNNSSSSPRPAKLTKPAKVPSWTKDMSLETYVKQLTTWQEINEDIPEFAKYHELIDSNTKNIKSLFQNVRKCEHSPSVNSPPPRPAKLTKPAKVPSWTKDMSLETYVKQLTTWQEINEDIP